MESRAVLAGKKAAKSAELDRWIGQLEQVEARIPKLVNLQTMLAGLYELKLTEKAKENGSLFGLTERDLANIRWMDCCLLKAACSSAIRTRQDLTN